MSFASIPNGSAVFLDANALIYHFSSEPTFGAAATQLVKRIELQQIIGFTSTHVLSDVAHRLMTLEAIDNHGWPAAGIATRLRRNPAVISLLTVHIQAISRIPVLGIQTLPIDSALVHSAIVLGQRHQLLTGDALIVAVMQSHGLLHLASNDADFDRVPGITRFAPV